MSKKEKSELQLAADRVRVIQVAIDSMKANLQVCETEYKRASLMLAETTRNLQDTQDLLAAQTSKLEREIQSVRNIVGYGFADEYVKKEFPF